MPTNYSQLDWPLVPDDLAAKCLAVANNNEDMWANYGSETENYKLYDAPEEFKKWAFANLPISDPCHIRVQKIKKTKFIDIHIDRARTIAFNYLLQGTNAYTAWYNSELKPIEHVKFTKHNWFSLAVDVPHNVFNITEDRVAITISYSDPTVKLKIFNKPLPG